MQFQVPKGTFDILPYGVSEPWRLSAFWQYIESIMRNNCAAYHYQEIRTPIYERTELFQRSVGETSDIVTKEMFSFEDKGGRAISLRPEGTASVMRAFIEGRLANVGSVHKFFYLGPMFRYERPQSGRYRQHHQFGVEAIGSDAPEQDAEVIDLLFWIYRDLGLKHLKVHINTVGDLSSRTAYKEALVAYLRPYFEELSADSRIRFEKNPLRILDSKDLKDQEILKQAPSILHYLSEEASGHFEKVCACLNKIQVPYCIDDKIVRGLDYYSKTVFEFLVEDLGSQGTLGGGGRYDGLLKNFGGPDLPGVGVATGMERVLQVMIAQKLSCPNPVFPFVYFVGLGAEGREECFQLATLCRHQKIPAEVELHAHKLQTGLQNAAKSQAMYCIIIGSDELQQRRAQLKHLPTHQVREIEISALIQTLQKEYEV